MWRSKSLQFTVVDMVAHHFKHIISNDEKGSPQEGHLPLPSLVFGRGALNTFACNTRASNEGGIDLHNLHFVILDAIKFVRQQAEFR
jgi:hypothetical protein